MGAFRGNLQKMLMQQVQQLQQQMETMQKELSEARVEAASGGGMVTVTANGLGELLEVKIAPEVVDPQEVEMLQDLVLAATREALAKAKDLQAQKSGGIAGGLNIPGLDLSGLMG